MSIAPIITFKAGICDVDASTDPPRVKPRPTPGYLYLYYEDELISFCWRPRSAPVQQPELKLAMVPADSTFTPYQPTTSDNPSNADRPTNGRIYVLKFMSSPQRYLFWLQSRSQHPGLRPEWFSARDLKLGQIVNTLLQGDDIDVQQAIANLPADQNDDQEDEDETMEDVEGTNHDPNRHHGGGGGGAGPGATGGDVREEGEEAREGGADGGRANDEAEMDPNTIIQNFIKSMSGVKMPTSQGHPEETLFTTLADLLMPASTLPFVEAADAATVDRLLQHLPPTLLTLAHNADEASHEIHTIPSDLSATSFSVEQKKDVLRRVLRSPQFSQSLASLTLALRDGGLPMLSEALDIPVRNGGYIRRGGVPIGGGDAVEVFLEGVKDSVQNADEPADTDMQTE